MPGLYTSRWVSHSSFGATMTATPAQAQAHAETEQTSIGRFAKVFTGYGIALGVILAAVPVATKATDLLPIYNTNRDVLTFATSLLSLLSVAFVFNLRRRIGEVAFPVSRRLTREQARRRRFHTIGVPLVLGTLAFGFLATYLVSVRESVMELARTGNPSETTIKKQADIAELLLNTPWVSIPYFWVLQAAYIGTFLCGVVAFVWLGIIEYVQMELGLSDRDLIANAYREMPVLEFRVPSIYPRHAEGEKEPSFDVYFQVQYEVVRDQCVLQPGPCQPWCSKHDRPRTA